MQQETLWAAFHFRFQTWAHATIEYGVASVLIGDVPLVNYQQFHSDANECRKDHKKYGHRRNTDAVAFLGHPPVEQVHQTVYRGRKYNHNSQWHVWNVPFTRGRYSMLLSAWIALLSWTIPILELLINWLTQWTNSIESKRPYTTSPYFVYISLKILP